MRRSDAAAVPDPYGKEDLSFSGGLLSNHDVKSGAPIRQWFAVQRCCAIDQPGSYDLYCISRGHYTQTTGEVQARAAVCLRSSGMRSTSTKKGT
jgi:hypothetical protein